MADLKFNRKQISSWMKAEPWPHRALDWLFGSFVMFFAAVSVDHPNKWVRVVSLLLQFLWFFPAMIISLAPILLLIISILIVDTWRGENS